jgi:kinesin family member 5
MKWADSEVGSKLLISSVVVRVRPFLQYEIQQSGKKGKDLCVKTYQPMEETQVSLIRKGFDKRDFMFDHCLPMDSGQEEAYK